MTTPTDWPVVLARLALVALGIGLFGWACFPLYAPVAPKRAATGLRLAAPLAATAAALAWIAALTREMEGTPGLPSLGSMVGLCIDTGFGRALTGAAALGLALAVLALGARRPPARLAAILSGGLLASLAFVGHAAAVGGVSGAIRIGVMALHLLFAGVWLGGLAPLALALRHAGPATEPLLRAFGKTAIGAVAVLVTTGMVAAAAILSLAGGPPGRTYLVAFGVKLSLVAGLLAVAGFNRWRLTPLSAQDPAAALRALKWTLALEQIFALALVAAVARLAQLDPGM